MAGSSRAKNMACLTSSCRVLPSLVVHAHSSHSLSRDDGGDPARGRGKYLPPLFLRRDVVPLRGLLRSASPAPVDIVSGSSPLSPCPPLTIPFPGAGGGGRACAHGGGCPSSMLAKSVASLPPTCFAPLQVLSMSFTHQTSLWSGAFISRYKSNLNHKK